MPGRGDRGGKKEKPRDAKKSLRRILSYLNDYRWPVIVLTLCAFISNFGNLLGPNFAGKAIHAAGAGAGKVDFDVVFFYGKCMLAAYLASGLLTFIINIGMMRVSRNVVRKMRKDVFDKLMTLPVGFFDRNQAGDIISRVSYDDVRDLPAAGGVYAGDDPHGHLLYEIHGTKDQAPLFEAQRRLRPHERFRGGNVHRPEDDPGIRL